MYRTEMERLNWKIAEAQLTQKSKRALHDLIEEFFAVDYQNISEKRKGEVELNFKLRCNESIMRINRIDFDEVLRIFNQIETSLFTILDRSVDKTRKSELEKIISSLPIKEITIFKKG